MIDRATATSMAQFLPQCLIVNKTVTCCRHTVDVLTWEEPACHSRLDHIPDACYIKCNDWTSTRHGLQRCITKTLMPAETYCDIALLVKTNKLLLADIGPYFCIWTNVLKRQGLASPSTNDVQLDVLIQFTTQCWE